MAMWSRNIWQQVPAPCHTTGIPILLNIRLAGGELTRNVEMKPEALEALKKTKKLLMNVKPESEPVDEITAIIMEETPAYFSGQKSAREVCEILQNRVELYFNERK